MLIQYLGYEYVTPALEGYEILFVLFSSLWLSF